MLYILKQVNNKLWSAIFLFWYEVWFRIYSREFINNIGMETIQYGNAIGKIILDKLKEIMYYKKKVMRGIKMNKKNIINKVHHHFYTCVWVDK